MKTDKVENKNNMRISVCIPCYNQSQYLAECIESVLAQTHKPHEIIVVNDGSQDETRYIVKQYDVKYIEQVNKGLASARNTGIMNMTGDWFYPLDADDKMLENCLKVVSDTIENNPDADIIAPSFEEFGIRNNTVFLMANPAIEDFKTGNRIGYFSAIRKSKLLSIGGYNPKMIWGWEDYDCWFDLLKNGVKIVTIPEVLILYRVKERSMINEANEHSTELWTQIYKNHPNIFSK